MDIKDLLDKFEWNNTDEENIDGIPQPEFLVAEKILSCAESIATYILHNLSIDSCEDQRVITIAIPDSIDPLLQERKNTKWSIKSRETVFEVIRGAFISITDNESYKAQIGEKLNKLFSPVAPIFDMSSQEMEEIIKRGSSISNLYSHPDYKVKWMRLYDDPPMLVSTHLIFNGIVDQKEKVAGGEIIVEIGINTE